MGKIVSDGSMTGHLFLVKVDRSLIGQLPVIIGTI
jgi:hypothetical protein